MFKNILLSIGVLLSALLNLAQAMDLEDDGYKKEGNTPRLAKEALSPSLEELSNKLFFIHKTTIVPNGETLYPAGQNTSYNHILERPTCPFSLHWSAFFDLEWKEGAYNICIMSPFSKLKNNIVIISMTEIVTLGPYTLGEEDYLLVPDNLPAPQLPTTVITYPAARNLTSAIQDTLRKEELFCIKSIPEQAEYDWENRDGILDEGIQISPEVFFANFFEIYPHVSLGSESGVKTGEWACLAKANHYPHLVYNFLSNEQETFRFKKWFFVLYSQILAQLGFLTEKYRHPAHQFILNRTKDILDSLQQYASDEPEEGTPSKKVFKIGLYGTSFSHLYDQLKISRGSLEGFEDNEQLELAHLWMLMFPSTPFDDLPKIIKPII